MAAPSGFLAGTGAAPTPEPGADACTLSNDLGWALGAVVRGYAKATHEALADLPGGPRGFQVLAAAAGDGLGSQLALAQRLGVDRTVMTYLLDDLEAAGLIERRPDPADRRARRIVATPPGLEALGRLEQRLHQAEEELLSGLDSQADRQTFRSLLCRLARQASAADPGRTSCEADGSAAGQRAGRGTLPC